MTTLQKIKMGVVGLASVAALGLGCVVSPAFAVTADDCAGKTGVDQTNCYAELANGGGTTDNLMGTLQQAINVVLGVIGFVAVVVIVYGGIQYTISAGDAAKVKKAKDTILYGIIGLIIALLAAAIVNFVLVGVFGAGTATGE